MGFNSAFKGLILFWKMVSNTTDNVNELEESDLSYDLQQSHLPPTV